MLVNKVDNTWYPQGIVGFSEPGSVHMANERSIMAANRSLERSQTSLKILYIKDVSVPIASFSCK